jgi:hypothetical protein
MVDPAAAKAIAYSHGTKHYAGASFIQLTAMDAGLELNRPQTRKDGYFGSQ